MGGGGFGRFPGIFGRKWKCLKFDNFVCSVFLPVLDKESISKVPINVWDKDVQALIAVEDKVLDLITLQRSGDKYKILEVACGRVIG